jgi:opacity protein-like surface antigen
LDDSKYVPKFPGIKNPYYGLSLRIEYDLSDYAKVFVKGGAELRKFTYSSSDFSEFQNVDQTIYGLQTGVAMKFPGTKRCKIQGCGVVMKHLHNGVEYRGSSIFQFQNRKIGQWY